MASREMLEDVVEQLTEQLKVAAASLKSMSEDFRQALEKIETLEKGIADGCKQLTLGSRSVKSTTVKPEKFTGSGNDTDVFGPV